jgi:hypothetical protein
MGVSMGVFRSLIGLIFKIPAGIIFFGAMIWGFFICLRIVIDQLGFIGGAIAFIFFPVTLAFAPWYEAISNGNWFPLLLIYGCGFFSTILLMVGSAISGD